MICVGRSDILFPGGTLGENLCIVYTLLPLLNASVITLHSTRITFAFIMLIDTICDRNISFDENPSDLMLLGLSKFIVYAHLISHLIGL